MFLSYRLGRGIMIGEWCAVISESTIAQIRERTDILALVGEYVNLKRIGSSTKGLCPFHSEKTPSFHVHPDRQFFHCFGCGASGDVFAFLMRMEGGSFPEVARSLAARAGIEVPDMDLRQNAEEARKKSERERWFTIMEDAAGFYMDQLHTHRLSNYAKAELDKRGIDLELAKQFRLGYAPHGWRTLVHYLEKRGHLLHEAETLGLILRRRSFGADAPPAQHYYDRFRHRLLFPVSDAHGRVVAFSGRMLEAPAEDQSSKEQEGAKYVNSPDTPLYKKGSMLFGLHEARVAMRREQNVLVCEGNFDLLALHRAGFAHSVAPLGTALTEAQAKLLHRYADTVTLIFDGDSAGGKAVRAAFEVLQRAGLGTKVAVLPPGSDPDSFTREHGEKALRDRISAAIGIVEYLIDRAADDAGSDAKNKADAIAELGSMIMHVDNPVEVQLYTERMARRFGLSDLQAVKRQLRMGHRKGRGRENSSIAGPSRASGASAIYRIPESTRREWEILGAFLDCPALFSEALAESFAELLTDPEVRVIFEKAAQVVTDKGALIAPVLLESLGMMECRGLLERRLSMQKYEATAAREILDRGIVQLAKQNIERELPMLARQVKEARRLGDDERALELTRERDRLYRSAQRAMQIAKG